MMADSMSWEENTFHRFPNLRMFLENKLEKNNGDKFPEKEISDYLSRTANFKMKEGSEGTIKSSGEIPSEEIDNEEADDLSKKGIHRLIWLLHERFKMGYHSSSVNCKKIRIFEIKHKRTILLLKQLYNHFVLVQMKKFDNEIIQDLILLKYTLESFRTSSKFCKCINNLN